MTSCETVRYETPAPGIARVTMNRPDARNAVTFEMYEALHDTCANLDADPGVRVLVLKGAGDRAFASGTDIRQFLAFKTPEDALGYEARLTRVLARLAGMSKPTIAMLQGDAIGAAGDDDVAGSRCLTSCDADCSIAKVAVLLAFPLDRGV